MACATEAETLTKQMKEPLPANQKIPKKLMHVLWKATEKEQVKRYQTALDFKHAIQESLLPDPPMSQRMGAWLQEHLTTLVLLFIIIALLASLATYILFF